MDMHPIKQNMEEHYKLMADFFKHLSVLSISLIFIGVGLSSKHFENFGNDNLLSASLLILFVSSIYAVIAQSAYVDAFRVPHLLSGNKYKKVAFSTITAYIIFLSGAGSLGFYIWFGIMRT